MNPENAEKKRVVLLMSPATYRAGAFLSAAKKLNLEVVVGIDLPETLAEYWHVPLGVDFAAPVASVRTIVENILLRPFFLSMMRQVNWQLLLAQH